MTTNLKTAEGQTENVNSVNSTPPPPPNIPSSSSLTFLGKAVRNFCTRISPFEFSTLKQIPLGWSVTSALLLTVLCFAGIWHWYERNWDMSYTISGNLAKFIHDVRIDKKTPPKILICGSSNSGLGISKDVLAERFNTTVNKSTIDSCWVWECYHILKKYPDETRNVQCIIIELMAGNNILNWKDPTGVHPENLRFKNGNSFHFLKDVTDVSIKNLEFISKLKGNPHLINNHNNYYLPMKFSLADLTKKICVRTHEELWDDSDYKKLIPQRFLQEMLPNIKQQQLSKIEPHVLEYSERAEDLLWEFVRYCEYRGIFIVWHIPPAWYNLPGFKPEGKNLTETDHRVLALIAALEKYPNCKVTYLKNFNEIISNLDEAGYTEYMFDWTHQTRKGATIYTNWLADQMLEDPKVVAALKRERKPEEFFVKKYLKSVVKPAYLYVKNGIKAQQEQHKKTPIFVVKTKPVSPSTNGAGKSNETKTAAKPAAVK